MIDDKVLVTFWGTRGSISAPGRSTEKYGGNTSCVSVIAGGNYFIFDAGTGIRPLGMEIMAEHSKGNTKPEINMFLSHTHWDHIQGLPFFIPAYNPQFKLKIYGKASNDKTLEDILVGQMHSDYFPVPMSAFGSSLSVKQVKQVKQGSMKIGNCKVSFNEMDHPGGSLSFKMEFGGKTIVYATDNELNTQFDEDGKLKKDNELGQNYWDFIKDADLIIADGQYTDEEYKQKVGWGHTTVSLLLKVAHAAGVKQVAVFHHDPMHTDNFLDELSAKFLVKYQDIEPKMGLFWAREGLTIAI